MKSNEPLENTLRKLRYRRADERRERALTSVMAAFNESQRGTPATSRREIGRIIVASRIAKLAAAAAIIVTAVFLWRVSIGTNKAYALTDVPHLVSQARTIHVRRRNFSNGRELLAEYWTDLENGRLYRYREGLASEEGPDGRRVVKHVVETIVNEAFVMTVDHTSKTVEFERRLTSQKEPRRAIMAARASTGTFEDIDHFDDYRLVGHGQIDSRQYDVWRRDFHLGDSGYRYRFEYWILPRTGTVERMRRLLKTSADRDWELISETERIGIDEVPPDGIFSTEPPAGYTLENDKATAEIAGLDISGFQSMQGHALRVPASFTLADGSILACWRGLHDSVGAGADSLYEGLAFGGDLPRAPAELLAMTTQQDENHSGPSTLYVGRHVATTRQAGRIYEWALYVPQHAVSVDGVADFTIAMIRLNAPDPARWAAAQLAENPRLRADAVDFEARRVQTYGLTSFCVTAETFARYVQPAFRELSENQVMSAEMTYDKLLTLAQQVRATPELYDAVQTEVKGARETIATFQPVDRSEFVTAEQANLEARQRVEAFYAAIREGRDGEAMGMLMYDESRARRVVSGMRQLPGFGEIAVDDVYATERAALVITSEFAGYEDRPGRWAISVLRDKGTWLIKDFDATTTDTMQEEIEKYLQSFPEAELFPGR